MESIRRKALLFSKRKENEKLIRPRSKLKMDSKMFVVSKMPLFRWTISIYIAALRDVRA